MDLRLILNPMPEPEDFPRITATNNQSEIHPEQQHTHPSTNYLHSRLFLSPRRLDPETASVSTNSSTKRRRTNRGRIDIRTGQTAATAMGRSFSELEGPSDTSSNDDEHDAVKLGIAQLSLSGTSPKEHVLKIDDHGMVKLGARVEALKSGTQGTWYVARIVELASFPAHYIEGSDEEDISEQWYPMVCVHYEGCPS
jgi:hypothetical protein